VSKASLVAGGVTGDRLWVLAADHRIRSRGGSGVGETPPLPPEVQGHVLAADVCAHSVAIVTTRREVWMAGDASPWRVVWRNYGMIGGDMNRGDTLTLAGWQRAGNGPPSLWAVTSRRSVMIGGGPNFGIASEIAGGRAVPGDDAIVGVLLAGRLGARVVTAGGDVFECGERSGWSRDFNLFDAEPTLAVKAVVPLDVAGRRVAVGEVVRLAESAAKREVLAGRAERVYDVTEEEG
jgi:hypothetical protein